MNIKQREQYLYYQKSYDDIIKTIRKMELELDLQYTAMARIRQLMDFLKKNEPAPPKK